LVDSDDARRRDRQFALESTHGHVVIPAASVREARDHLAARDLPLVITSATIGDSDVVALLRRIPDDTALAPSVIVLAEVAEHGLRRLAWSEGAVAVLTEPIDDSELAAVVRRVLALRNRRLDALLAEQRMTASMDHLTDLLVTVLDAAIPGSALRGTRLTTLVARLSRDFAMEETFADDLRRAARLHEIGRITLVAGHDWIAPGAATMASARLVSQVPALAGVAQIIEFIGANWDGSGVPAGVQRGQIPVRSRLLRAGIDLLTAGDAQGGDDDLSGALDVLRPHSGGWYDPAVISALSVVVSEDRSIARVPFTMHVSYDQLAVGMQLAADLHTVSGVKLLAAGTVLTDVTLQLIQRRHELDPLVLPATVEQLLD
jgi:response regulator RpfG family c-di-GMP phosphodiesterase